MNRLSPLIVRSVGRHAPPAVAVMPVPGAPSPAWIDDVKLFATGWVGGLIFFGTMLS